MIKTKIDPLLPYKLDCCLLTILAFTLLVRIPYLIGNTIPFMYDHGRDGIAVLHMLLTCSPKFVGPAASLQGLFFGPGWYYLIAPFYLVGLGNPVFPVFAMVLLSLIEVYLAYRYFGKFAALIIAASHAFMSLAVSAWNPFPMPLLTLILLILFKKTKETGTLTSKQGLLMGITASFGFHFSTAYAIFYPVIIAIALFLQKIKVRASVLVLVFLGFIVPLIPQILFEIKHNFPEVRGVIAYVTQGNVHESEDGKIGRVVMTVFDQLTSSSLPEIWLPSEVAPKLATTLVLAFLAILVWYTVKNHKKLDFPLLGEALLFIVIPTFGYFFLHFSLWYTYPMLPAAVILVSKLIENSPKLFQRLVVLLLILSPLTFQVNYFLNERDWFLGHNDYLPAKLKALEVVRQEAEDKPFASYHYTPSVYDYTYQHLYFIEAWRGKTLPVEFSYKPGEVAYIPEKPELLARFETQENHKPELIFFIVEKQPAKFEEEELLFEELRNQWWRQQLPHKVIEEIPISPHMVVYKAVPISAEKASENKIDI
ncbi:MAG: hypothetical protein ACOX6V_03155 [Patescibacteria group bacterium]|jgi:hypothetical protein